MKYVEQRCVFGDVNPLPADGVIQVFYTDDRPEMVRFVCPLDPSIRWLAGCFAHFNITDGDAIIHADSGKH